MKEHSKINCGPQPVGYMTVYKVGAMHFLPPGVAHTTGLSHNPFTRRPI